MSAGDIDDRLGPAAELERLRATHRDLDDYIRNADSLPILRVNVPFGAGISSDGQRRYIDSRLDTILIGMDVSQALGTHEAVEWALREFCQVGMDYAMDPRGHRLANRAEYQKLSEIFNIKAPDEEANLWEAYDTFLDPQLINIQKLPLTDVPEDLALYPYRGTSLYYKIREAQL